MSISLGLRAVLGIMSPLATIITENLTQALLSLTDISYRDTGSRDAGVSAALLGLTILLFFFSPRLLVKVCANLL